MEGPECSGGQGTDRVIRADSGDRSIKGTRCLEEGGVVGEEQKPRAGDGVTVKSRAQGQKPGPGAHSTALSRQVKGSFNLWTS